jgi:hypothetical protein
MSHQEKQNPQIESASPVRRPCRHKPFIIIALCTSSLALTGCQHKQFADERADRRAGVMQHTLETIAESEAVRPARLERAGRWIEKEIADDVVNTEQNAGEFVEFFRRDFDRFKNRQTDYQRTIGEILYGKPENLEPNAIRLFW